MAKSRVSTCLVNLKLSGNLAAVREKVMEFDRKWGKYQEKPCEGNCLLLTSHLALIWDSSTEHF